MTVSRIAASYLMLATNANNLALARPRAITSPFWFLRNRA